VVEDVVLVAARLTADSQLQPTLRSRLETAMARQPDAVAVEDDAGSLSYPELRRRADRLAQALLRAGAAPEQTVAVRLPRARDRAIALVAIVRTGAACVPIDPAQPAHRQATILRDSRARALVTDGPAADLPVPVLRPDVISAGRVRPLPDVHPDQLAYVLYTSGSTGTPKGVAVSHRALVHYLDWAAQHYGADGHVLVQTSPAFDLTLTTLFTPLLGGGRIRLVGGDDITACSAALAGRSWSLVKVTPAHLVALNALWDRQPVRTHVDVLVVGGEALHRRHLTPWPTSAPGTRVFNEYGPTETTVGCCVHEVGDDDPDTIPIGTAIPHASVAVGDELLIGGPSLARGYLGQPGPTAACFRPDPATTGGRRYPSGDVAGLRPDGRLVYHGRRDRQLKIRGHRVEPGEVEAVLRSCPDVQDAAVAGESTPDGRTRLVGYVVARAGTVLDRPALRAYLAERLAEPMVPGRIVALHALPLTPNGKVDHSRLVRR
jgi:nonribosomal peptide synthetase protein BlmVI